MFIANHFILGSYIKYLKIVKKKTYCTCITLAFIIRQYIPTESLYARITNLINRFLFKN